MGVVAARKLLKAVKAGQLAEVDLLGCSFGVLGASSTVAWDPHDPDGVYDLDLEVPAHYQVGGERSQVWNSTHTNASDVSSSVATGNCGGTCHLDLQVPCAPAGNSQEPKALR